MYIIWACDISRVDLLCLLYYGSLLFPVESSLLLDMKRLLASLALVYITTITYLISVMFMDAISLSYTDLMMNSAIILILNDLNDQVLVLCVKFAPKWMGDIDH